MNYLGNTYDLLDVPAYDLEGKEIKINGRYTVEEFQGYEPAAGITSEYFTLVPEHADDSNWESLCVTVDPYNLEFALDREGVERREAQEREWEQEQIRAEARQAEEEAEMYHHRFMAGEQI